MHKLCRCLFSSLSSFSERKSTKMKSFGVFLAICVIISQVHGEGTCVTPNCVDVAERRVLWAHPTAIYYYMCVAEFGQWIPAVLACQCGTFFDASNQRCELPQNWSSTCQSTDPTPTPIPCDGPAPTTPGVTTTPIEIPTVPVVIPTAPTAGY